MRVLVLRQKVSILVVFHGRPQLIGLSLRAHVLNSAKKGMDSFPGHIYICVYICICTLPSALRVCVYIRARKTFKEEEDEEEERENLGEKNTEKREKSCQKREERERENFGDDDEPAGGADE